MRPKWPAIKRKRFSLCIYRRMSLHNTVLLLRKFVINQRRNEVKYINDLQATSYIIFNTISKLTHSSIENKTITVLVVRSDH